MSIGEQEDIKKMKKQLRRKEKAIRWLRKQINNYAILYNDILEQAELHDEELKQEIERLNNTINEIEDSIVGKINVLYQVKGQKNAIQELNILLRQLRELKGVDKK